MPTSRTAFATGATRSHMDSVQRPSPVAAVLSKCLTRHNKQLPPSFNCTNFKHQVLVSRITTLENGKVLERLLKILSNLLWFVSAMLHVPFHQNSLGNCLCETWCTVPLEGLAIQRFILVCPNCSASMIHACGFWKCLELTSTKNQVGTTSPELRKYTLTYRPCQSIHASALLWCLAMSFSCRQTCRLFRLSSPFLGASQTWPSCLVAFAAWTPSCSLRSRSWMLWKQNIVHALGSVGPLKIRCPKSFLHLSTSSWHFHPPVDKTNLLKPERTRWRPRCRVLGVSWYFKISNLKKHIEKTLIYGTFWTTSFTSSANSKTVIYEKPATQTLPLPVIDVIDKAAATWSRAVGLWAESPGPLSGGIFGILVGDLNERIDI